MHNFLRKSIIIIAAGFILLLLYTCKTTSDRPSDIDALDSRSMELFFPGYREAIVYIKTSENEKLVDSFISSFMLKGAAESTIKSSNEIFIASGLDAADGYDIILKGDYSRFSMELGLFFSFSWKKITTEGYEIWQSRDGLNLSFINNDTIVISTTGLTYVLDTLKNYNLIIPEPSLLVTFPSLNSDSVRKLSSGFIKGGVESFTVALTSKGENYSLESRIMIEDGKAKAFSRLINIFLKLAFSGSADPDMVSIGDEYQVFSENSTVLINNIVLNQKKVIELLNNLLVIKGEADK